MDCCPCPLLQQQLLFEMANAPVAAPPNNAHNTGEMVTPTGAAILTTIANFEHPRINVSRIAYGLGTRDSQQYPNALALWIGTEQTAKYSTGVKLVETNIDDMSGEMLGYVQERLFEMGARDVWFTPIQMKKNRPATMLSVIVSADNEAETVDLMMRETSTLGVRVRQLERIEADREVVQVETSLGKVAVKLKRLNGAVVSVAPEYEDARVCALKHSLSLQEVFSLIQREAESQIMA